jgi:phosphoserine phosphatase
MTHIATLIATNGFDVSAVAQARSALPEAGGVSWLAPGIAADIPFTAPAGNDNRALTERVRLALGGAPIDVVVQPAADRRKRLFLADMDSTMIAQECIDELADFVGLKAHVAAITARAMRGEIEFAPALRERVALLKGLSTAVVDEVIRERITLVPGGRTLVATMRAHGALTCLVTGGFTLFSDRIGQAIGFDETRANTLALEANQFAGTVTEPIFGREGKLQTLIELRDRLGLRQEETMAIGDGANDLAMIQEAGLGVAVHAKPLVSAAAAARIDHGDLTTLLYAQGYRRDEFVES